MSNPNGTGETEPGYDASPLEGESLEKRETEWMWHRQIRCIGPTPAKILAIQGDDGLTDRPRTPRSFCALEKYGGYGERNMGGYCRIDLSPPQVVFEAQAPSPITREQYQDYDLRVAYEQRKHIHQLSMAFCNFRCRCLSPRVLIRMARHESIRPGYNSRTDFEVVRSEMNPRLYDKNPKPRYDMIQTDQIRLFDFPNVLPYFLGAESGNEVVVWAMKAPSIFKKPSCLNMLPAMVPRPFRLEDFDDAQHLCASIFHGGNYQGNAGGVCKPIRESSRHFFSMEEIFAHPSFLESYGEVGLATYLWCLSICKCNADDRQIQVSVKINLWRDQGLWAFFRDGKVYPRREDGSDPPPGTPKVLESHFRHAITHSGGQQSCQFADDDSCIENGLIEKESCYGSCNGPSQCGGDDCKCVAWPTELMMHAAGYEPFLPRASALCMSLGALSTVSIAEKIVGKTNWLGGRDVGSLSCVCNQSYISTACCGAGNDGLVWEDPSLSLGTLDQLQ